MHGLGSLNANLPTFIVLPDARGLPYNLTGNFTSEAGKPNPIPDLQARASAGFIGKESDRERLALLAKMNRRHLAMSPGDAQLEARIASYEMAARMQMSAPEALDISKESEATRKLYGVDRKETEDFGKRCLIARRLVERGVRFVQVWSGTGGASGNWDMHTNIAEELPKMAGATDQPTTALLHDLKTLGLMEDTLVVWSAEFGRTPYSQGAKSGRDHNGGTFNAWLAGAGIKGGVAYGESDELGWKAAVNPTYCYDLHATILHLMGVDHTRLTFQFNGIDRRLTDVHGHVIAPILA